MHVGRCLLVALIAFTLVSSARADEENIDNDPEVGNKNATETPPNDPSVNKTVTGKQSGSSPPELSTAPKGDDTEPEIPLDSTKSPDGVPTEKPKPETNGPGKGKDNDDKKVTPPKKSGASSRVTGAAWLLTLIVAAAMSFLD